MVYCRVVYRREVAVRGFTPRDRALGIVRDRWRGRRAERSFQYHKRSQLNWIKLKLELATMGYYLDKT